MLRGTEAFLAELGLQRADHPVHEWGDDPGSRTWRAHLTHPVLCRMLEEAESLAPLWKVSREVAFSLLCDLVIEESERSPFGSVAIEEGAEAMAPGKPRQDLPRAPEWAVALDSEQKNEG
jgi:hypothetical protein